MANNRDQQEVVLVVTTGIAREKDHQEVLLVIGPPMSATTPSSQARRPQVCVNT